MPTYKLGNPQIVYETIEGETVVVDLATGSYYSLVGAGSILWIELINGRTMDDILARLDSEYDASPQEIETAVQELLQEMLKAQIIALVTPAQAPDPATPVSRVPPDPAAPKRKFKTPHLEIFSDIQELLLLDPVHDVNETGWPHANNKSSG